MFKNLKDKLTNAISSQSDDIEEEEVTEEEKEALEEPENDEDDEKGFFGTIKDKVTKFEVTEDSFEDLFWDIQVALLENNVAMEVIEKIKEDLKNDLVGERITRRKPEQVIQDSIKQSIEDVLDFEPLRLEEEIKNHKPDVIVFIGVNGSGKTTSLAKLAHRLQKQGNDIVMAAGDTFRAAAIDQLQEHATNLDIKLIKHDYESDPAAVGYDAVEHAKKEGKDVVLIDTAGRLHNNENLMQELRKIIDVTEPDMKIFVGESITGNDCIQQAKRYNEKIGIDGLILSKTDLDDKGGAPLSVSYITKKPILYLGTGQDYDDLEPFDKDDILTKLDL